MKKIKKYRNVFLRIIDIAIITISYYIAEIILRGSISANRLTNTTIIIAIISYTATLNFFKTYKNITRYENGTDYLVYVVACLSAYIIISTLKIFFGLGIVSQRTNIIAALIIVVSIISYRVLLRMILTEGYKNPEAKEKNDRKNVLIIGAGDAAKTIIGTLKTNMKDVYNVIGLIDDNINKVDYAISGKKILGTRYDIPRICRERNIELILFTISNISNEDRKNILRICQETGCKVRILPGTKELIKNKNLMENFRDVEIEDLLGRDPIKLNNKNIKEMIENQVILVTGGGGSIGSELCRQIIKYNPQKLVILDIYRARTKI